MSWFKKQIDNYSVNGAPLTDEDKKNPFTKSVVEEDFEIVHINLDDAGELLIPRARVAKEVKDGGADKFTNVSS